MVMLLSNVVNDVITELSQVPGQSTQIYATPRIQLHVQSALEMEMEEMWWPQLMCRQEVMIDATTGIPTADIAGPISNIDEYGDIQAVFLDGKNRKLSELPQSLNPYSITGMRQTFISADGTVPHRPFRVWPAQAATVVVIARQRPTIPMASNSPVYLDHLLLRYDACWMYAVDDGTIPAQVNKFQVLATRRRKMMKDRYAQHPLLLDPRYPFGDVLDNGQDTYFVLDSDPLA